MPFITFEGIDGSGKSSLLDSLASHLKSNGHLVEITREPGGSTIGPEIRKILLRTDGVAPCPEAELLLYEADRAQHVALKIRPLLEKNYWVLSDRFADSSLAFQGAGRKIAQTDVAWLNQFATQGLKPDATILVDCSVELSLERRTKREKANHTKPDRFENENQKFHQAVRDEYLALAKNEPKRWIVIDSDQAPEEIFKTLKDQLRQRGLL